MPDGPPLAGPWGDHVLSEDEERTVDLGPLRLHVRRTRDEVWLAHEGAGVAADAPAVSGSRVPEEGPTRSGRAGAGSALRAPGEELDWSRWALPSPSETVRLAPALPDRPVVVEPERPFHLVRGARVRVYVRVPLHVRVATVGGAETTLARLPTVTLSDTWFGDFREGELAYFVPTTARREIRDEHFAPHLAACPIQLSNRADEELKVEKLALRVAHLSLFVRDHEFWADETLVRYRGADLGSDLRMSGEPPSDAPDARRIAPPEVPAETGFRARTFARIVQLPGFGGGT